MDRKDRIISELRQFVADLQKQILRQDERIADLELKLAKALKNSSNSSKPPSSDIVSPTKRDNKTAKKTGKKRRPGGQPGHKRHERTPFTEDQILSGSFVGTIALAAEASCKTT